MAGHTGEKRDIAPRNLRLKAHNPPQTSAIDDVHRTIGSVSEDQKPEGKVIVEELARLKYELQHNRHLT